MRFGVVGSSVKLRVWADGGSEPSTWNYEETDTTYTLAAPMGVRAGPGNLGSRIFELDDMSVDTTWPVSNISGTSALTTGTAVTAGGLNTEIAGSALTTGTALVAGGMDTALAASALSVATALAAAGLNTDIGQTAMSVATALSAAGVPISPGDAALSVGTSLTTVHMAEYMAAAALSTATALAAVGRNEALGGAALSTGTAVASAGVVGQAGTSALSVATSLATTVTVLRLGSGGLITGTVVTAVGASYTPPPPTKGFYELFVRDSSLRTIGQVDDFISLAGRLVYNDIGTWQCEISSGSPAADLLDPALNPGGGVVIKRDGEVLMTGPISGFTDDWDIDNPYNEKITVMGTDDNIWLWSRVIYPDYTHVATYAYSNYEDLFRRVGGAGIAAESIMIQIVKESMGSIALVARRLARLVIPASLGRGRVVTTQRWRYDKVLGEALQELSIKSRVGTDPTTDLQFNLQQEGQELVFRVDNQAVKAPFIRFSRALGTIKSSQMSTTAAVSTNALLGAPIDAIISAMAEEGDTEEKALAIANEINPFSLADTIYPRYVEEFVDVGAIDHEGQTEEEIAAEINDKARENFETQGGQIGASIVPLETEFLSFNKDYHLGDYCTVILPRKTFVERIREVGFSTDAGDGEKLEIVVGTLEGPYNRNVKGAYRPIKKLKDAIKRSKKVK
jgi:hypothetical protein